MSKMQIFKFSFILKHKKTLMNQKIIQITVKDKNNYEKLPLSC